jgi:hypothetical protein
MHDLQFYPVRGKDIDQHINALRVAIQNERIIIHPRCVRLKDDLRNGVWKNDSYKVFAHAKDASHFDTIAALMYFWVNADMKRNPAPREERYVRSLKNENQSGHTEPAGRRISRWSRRGYRFFVR